MSVLFLLCHAPVTSFEICQVSAQLAPRHGGKVNGLLTAQRLTIAKQLEQHSHQWSSHRAIHDRKVTGEAPGRANPE